MPSGKVVVADAGPLIALARVGGLRFLPRLFAKTFVTETALAECLVRQDRPEWVEIKAALDAGWLTRYPDPTIPAEWGLGAGESSAIGLALSQDAGLLADDRAARRVAAHLGLPVIGVLGVLILARRAGAVPVIRPLIHALVESGYFLASALIEEALRRAGE